MLMQTVRSSWSNVLSTETVSNFLFIFLMFSKSQFLTNENRKVAEQRFRAFSLCFLASMIIIIAITVIPESGR